jgi:hypothetical protein
LSEANVAISLSILDLSANPARQYLKMVISDIGYLLHSMLFDGEFLSPILSDDSDGASSASSTLRDLPSELVGNPLST